MDWEPLFLKRTSFSSDLVVFSSAVTVRLPIPWPYMWYRKLIQNVGSVIRTAGVAILIQTKQSESKCKCILVVNSVLCPLLPFMQNI